MNTPCDISDTYPSTDRQLICTCGGQDVAKHIQKVLNYLSETPIHQPKYYTTLCDLLIYSYEHMSYIATRPYLLDALCEELEQADYLLTTNPAWKRYQLLKYVYLPSFSAGQKLAYATRHHSTVSEECPPEENAAFRDIPVAKNEILAPLLDKEDLGIT